MLILLVDSNGKVSDVRIHHHINELFDKQLERAILLTSGKWEAPKINNKKVNVLKEIEIHYIEFPSMENQNGDLVISPSKLISEEYISNFKMAVKKFYQSEFSTALEKLPQKANLKSQKINLAYFKSIIFKSLNDQDCYDKFRKIILKSDFQYLIDN